MRDLRVNPYVEILGRTRKEAATYGREALRRAAAEAGTRRSDTAFNEEAIPIPTLADLVARWPLTSLDLTAPTTILDRGGSSYDLTAADAPAWEVDPWGGANGAWTLNGTSQGAARTVADWRSADSAGSVCGWGKFTDLAAARTLWGSSDQSTSTSFLYVLVRSATGRLSIAQRNAAGTLNNIEGTTVLVADTWYHLAVTSSGTAWALYVNGVAEDLTVLSGANTGDWLADTTLRDNISVGVLKHTSEVSRWAGALHDVRYYSSALSAANIRLLYRNEAY